jgi:hypothetical protein
MIQMGPKVSQGCEGRGTEWWWDVEALEGGYTCSLGVHDIICCGEGEVISGEGECDIREGSDFVTIDGVCSVPRFLGTNFLVQ